MPSSLAKPAGGGGARSRSAVPVTARGPAIGVPVPPLGEARGRTEDVVLGPDHEVRGARRHGGEAARADVGLPGSAGGDRADHPFAVGGALTSRDPRAGALQVQFRGGPGSVFAAGRPSGALSGHGAAGSVGTRHDSILPQPGRSPATRRPAQTTQRRSGGSV